MFSALLEPDIAYAAAQSIESARKPEFASENGGTSKSAKGQWRVAGVTVVDRAVA
jgi:hypothetical protein